MKDTAIGFVVGTLTFWLVFGFSTAVFGKWWL
jgi:hypothetical protein